MNWGCGGAGEPGWVNSDLKTGPGIQISADIRDGLPVPDDTFDYVVSIHALNMIPYPEVVAALEELRRVLRPGGVLRLVLPDFDKAIDAYRRGDRSYFLVPDHDERTLSGKAIVQLLWYGWSTLLCTEEWLVDLCERAGFSRVRPCRIGSSPSGLPGITELDNRPDESFVIEAVK
jgi:predicted SAM-dependent methyltransferase